MHFNPVSAVLLLFLLSCKAGNADFNVTNATPTYEQYNDVHYTNIAHIPLPEGYQRTDAAKHSFTDWLRMVRLKTSNTVYLYDGTEKQNQTAQFAVLDISVGKKDLQQCADAVVRLRAEYLFEIRAFDQIRFTDNEGTEYRFKAPFTRDNFDVYLRKVFGMCGSASLSKQLHAKNIRELEPGDVIIREGFPGHAVIVMDAAVNEQGQKIYLLAQSYMPAQDVHVLKNPLDEALSPWYKVSDEAVIVTPEYTFKITELKAW